MVFIEHDIRNGIPEKMHLENVCITSTDASHQTPLLSSCLLIMINSACHRRAACSRSQNKPVKRVQTICVDISGALPVLTFAVFQVVIPTPATHAHFRTLCPAAKSKVNMHA